MNKNNPNNSRINVYTASSSGQLKISTSDIKQTISATNNRAQYYADLAKKYRDEAKLHRDNAQYYAEQNSDVTFDYINGIRSSLEYQISLLQPAGDYALKEELPVNVSELENDSLYINETQLDSAIDEVRLPDCNEHAGQILSNDGERIFWTGINSFNLFDTKIVDRVLDGDSAIGWALAGTYVYKEALAGSYYGYPDFYAKCLEEYNEATNTETVNGVTIKIHSNGHKFYDIADKTSIDNYFNSMGSAWFYGIDTENERVFLPRNNWFEQVMGDVSKVGQSVQAGLPNIKTSETHGVIRVAANGYQSEVGKPFISTGTVNTVGEGAAPLHCVNIDISTINPIYGNSTTVQPNAVKKLLYICVGNTINHEGVTDIVNQGMDILEQVNQGFESRLNLNVSNISTEGKKTITSWVTPDYTNAIVGNMGTTQTTTFTAPAEGWVFISIATYRSGVEGYATINGYKVLSNKGSSTNYINCVSGNFYVHRGDVVYLNSPYTGVDIGSGYRFFPMKGAN